MKTDDKLEKLWDTWQERIREENCQTQYAKFRTCLLKLAMVYARMAVLSFAFVHVYGRETSDRPDDAFFWRVSDFYLASDSGSSLLSTVLQGC